MLVIGRNHSVSKVLPSLLAIQMLALGTKKYKKKNEITHVWNGNSSSFMVHYTLPLLCWFVSYNWAALTARRWATSQPPGKTWTKYQKENPTLMKIWWNQGSKFISASSQLYKLCLISVDFLSFQKGFGIFLPTAREDLQFGGTCLWTQKKQTKLGPVFYGQTHWTSPDYWCATCTPAQKEKHTL